MRISLILIVSLLFVPIIQTSVTATDFRAGAAVIDITPTELPVIVNGSILSRIAKEVITRLHARAIVLDDGKTRLAIVVADSCMMPRDLLDEAKEAASKTTKIPVSNMLISATHAHSAPSAFGALGTAPDPKYVEFLKVKLAEAIEAATKNLEPAQVGSVVADANEYTALRRWIRRPDRLLEDPFGNKTVRANMHPGHQSPDAIGPSGPEDPDLSLISFQARDGRPIALLANFANHYVGARSLSADYFGMFADRVANKIVGDEQNHARPFIGIMSQGTSGDVWLRDYFKPKTKTRRPDIDVYTDGMVKIAYDACKTIKYKHDISIAMAEVELPLKRRIPNKQRLGWAKRVVDEMEGPEPKTKTEVYAREAIILHENPKSVLKLQAIRIGDIGITAIPNEVYALTGIKLKELSPLQPTVNIELANGAEGYIPPAEQYPLGGYNTWPARSAGLEVQAESKIVETVLQQLEKVAGKPRRTHQPTTGPATLAIIKSKPVAYWRMDEMTPPRAIDELGRYDGVYETGVVYYLTGPHSRAFNSAREINRCAHFAGERMRARVPLGETWSAEMWIWNGMVTDARPVTGYMFSRGNDHAHGAPGDHLGIGGTHNKDYTGRIIFFNGNGADQTFVGGPIIERWKWYHVVLVRESESVKVYLNGKLIIDVKAMITTPSASKQIFIGGRNDNFANFEGRIDEVAVYDRKLGTKEILTHLVATVADKLPRGFPVEGK